LDWWSRVISEWNNKGSPNGRLLRKKVVRTYTYWVWEGTGPPYALDSPILQAQWFVKTNPKFAVVPVQPEPATAE
jgi:hypothetical protein